MHLSGVPYEWFAHLYSLVSRSFQCPIFCHGVCARRSRPPFLAVIALVASLFDPALSMAIGSKIGLSLLASEAIVYVVPRTRACRPDRSSKTIFPKDVSENMTWMCLANPASFVLLSNSPLGSRRYYVVWIERTCCCPISLRYRILP